MNIADDKLVDVEAPILVASDNMDDAALVKRALQPEFRRISLTLTPESMGADFDRDAPRILILAFPDLPTAERRYLGLYRSSSTVRLQRHHTILLVSKDDLAKVYELCAIGHFDDYVLFWPMTADVSRLAMSCRLALRNPSKRIDHLSRSVPFAPQARQLLDLGNVICEQMASQGPDAQNAQRVKKQGEAEIDAIIASLSKRLTEDGHADQRPKSEIAEVQNPTPSEIPSPKKSTKSSQHTKTILVVDDDNFQLNIAKEVLTLDNYQMLVASNGTEALRVLQKECPDLILMDMEMPNLNGIETTLRIRDIPQFAHVPIIMVSGKSERVAVTEGLRAGITDFVVKPFRRDTLLAKVAAALSTVKTE